MPGYSYLTPEGREALKRYKYHGQDRSLIYRYILTPMNAQLIQLFPLWVAPNLITLMGMVSVVFGHLLVFHWAPALTGEAPWWVYVVDAACTFVYQTLDNLDGRQARRTGEATPLGLLFDHGCDALNTTVSAITLAGVLQTGPTWKAYALWVAGALPFFLATWEELYTGELILPVVNGPTEGVLLIVVIKLWTAFAGPGFWLRKDAWGMCENNTILVVFGVVYGAIAAVCNMVNVYKHKGRQGPYWRALAKTGPFLALNGLALAWVHFSDIEVVHPRIFAWLAGLLFSKLVLHIMLAHMCDEPYDPLQKTLIPVFFVASHAGWSLLRGKALDQFDQSLFAEELLVFALMSYVHMVVSVVYDICNTLDIYCFVIKHPKVAKTL